MKKIYTKTNACFNAADGKLVSYQEILEALRVQFEVYGNTKGACLSEEDLEDAYQDAVLKVLRYSGKFDPGKSQAKTWASRIGANVQIDQYKAYRKREDWFESMDDNRGVADFCNRLYGNRSTDYEVESREAVDYIMKAIGSLNETQRLVLSLTIDGMKPREIADELGISSEKVSRILCHTRKALVKALGPRFLGDYGFAA